MTTKNRIASIRLLNRLEHNPEYANLIGVDVEMKKIIIEEEKRVPDKNQANNEREEKL